MRARLPGVVSLIVVGIVSIESGRAQEKTPARPLEKLAGTEWTGKGVLWFGGPTHDDPNPFEGTLSVGSSSVTYTWVADGKPQKGTLTLTERGATWTDSWHQPKKVELSTVPEAWGLLSLHSPTASARAPTGAGGSSSRSDRRASSFSR